MVCDLFALSLHKVVLGPLFKTLVNGSDPACFWSLQLTRLRIYFAQRPVREEHLWMMEQTKTRQTNRQAQAALANKSFARVIHQIFQNFNSKRVLNRLQLDYIPETEEESKNQTDAANLCFSLNVAMAAHRSWSLVSQSELPPDYFIGVVDSDGAAASTCLAKMKSDCEIVENAWSWMTRDHEDKEVLLLFFVGFFLHSEIK